MTEQLTQTTSESPLKRLTTLLGEDVFFVPCEWGTKKPIVTYTERPFQATKTASYLAAFVSAPRNIAVYLGKASGGLCAIDFDRDEDLTAFLKINPKLTGTLRSRGSRGGMVWLRIDGEYPESGNSPNFEWRADNRLSTIYGRHPKGMDYSLAVEGPPSTVRFEEIVWPTGWELPWVKSASDAAAAELEKTYGQPFYLNKGRVSGINERYWAGLYARETNVLYEPEEGEFYLYNEARGLWQKATVDKVRDSISARLLEISREAREFSLEMQITQSKVGPVVNALKAIAERRGVFREKQPLIHVANGVIRFEENGDVKFGGFSPEDFSRNQSPYVFDPKAECPRFLNELIYPAVNEEDADLLQRWAGLALFGYNLPQRFLILDGVPNGGKGTLVRIIQALTGVENTYQLRTECLQERFETFRYRGKTLLIGPDVRGTFLMEKGATMLKVLVGGDPVSAEGKGLNGDFAMFGTWNIIMTCNSRLRVRIEDDASAWRRRLLIVRYEKPPPAKRILDFDRVLLREEGSGILRWAMAGFVKLQEEFRDCGDFRLTARQRERIDALLSESESLKVFLRERVEPYVLGDVTKAEIFQAYAEFCAERGWNALALTTVERQLPDLMLELFQRSQSHSIEREGKGQRGWRNLRIKPA